jgi:two-component system sensor histidine kinase AlgZ
MAFYVVIYLNTYERLLNWYFLPKEAVWMQKMQNERDNNYFLPDLCKSTSLIILIIATEIIAIVFLLLKPWHEITLEAFGWISLYLQWITLFSSALLCSVRKHLMNLPNTLAAMLAFILIVTVIISLSVFLEWLQTGEISWQKPLRNGLIGTMLAALLIRYLYVSSELSRQSKAELTARLEALQARIRPHFLFNSMNTIASLIAIDPDKAEKAVEDLSALFRATLGNHNTAVSIDEEIKLCKRYIAMEQLRLGNRLTVSWQLDDLPTTATIPLLTLQPIIENAIYHGIQPSSKPGWIEISISAKTPYESTETNGSELTLKVANSLPLNKTSSHSGQKMALGNIQARLKAIYGEETNMKAEVIDNSYVTEITYTYR